MIIWLEKALVIAIHDRQLAEFGGSDGLRDTTLLESALARPQQLYAYGDPPPDLAQLAASLAFGLARNHPFVDGNKRTAYVAYRTFLVLNGAELEATDEDKYLTMLALAEGKLSEKEFAAWLGTHLRAHARGSVHEPRSTYKSKSRTRKPSSKKVRPKH
ncbi:MAG: type II toxin-antitoxin system death-on-curing family toxin [Gammaproteobacteria bacterium]